jgi:phosphatidate cytidylyltransferase
LTSERATGSKPLGRPDLGRRLVVAGVGIPFGVAIFYFGAWPTGLVLSAVAAVGTLELFRMAQVSGWKPFPWLGLPAAAALVLTAIWEGGLLGWSAHVLAVTVLLLLASLGSAVFLRGPAGHPLPSVAVTVFGPLYLGVTLGFALQLRAFPGISEGEPGWAGALLGIFALTVPWVGDAAAYFAGHRWGKTKLIPSVSPGKTVAGGVGGLVGSVLTAVAFSELLLNPYSGTGLSVAAAAVMGLVIGAVGQVGDLAESLLKRGAGVKDSGALFPGHGGVLDRFDSVLFALPTAYLLLAVFVAP